MEELGEGGGEESRNRDKERAVTAPAARRRYRGYPVAMDATGKQTDKDNTTLCSRADFVP